MSLTSRSLFIFNGQGPGLHCGISFEVKRDSLHISAREKRILFLLIEEKDRQEKPGIIFLGVLRPLLYLTTYFVPSGRRVPVAVWELLDW